jgi:Ca2+-binding RTX toxin-like protein
VKRTSLFLVPAAALLLAAAPTASADVITGGPGDNVLTGTDQRDWIYARAGNDTVAGNGASDFLFGGRGMDTVSGDGGHDYVWGGPGADTLEGGPAGDVLYAGWGVDALEGNGGNDRLVASENDGAPDVADCGAGYDRAVIRTGDRAIDCERVRTVRGRHTRVVFMRGTDGDDTLIGSDRKRDFILARAGNDSVFGLGRSDFLFGQRGNDRLSGGEAGDYVWGGTGDDVVRGGPGYDSLWAGAGADVLGGGVDNDRLHAAADDGAPDTLNCGENPGDRDRAVLRPGDTAIDCERVYTLPS